LQALFNFNARTIKVIFILILGKNKFLYIALKTPHKTGDKLNFKKTSKFATNFAGKNVRRS